MSPLNELTYAFVDCIESLLNDYMVEARRYTDERTARETAMGCLAGIVGARCVILFVSWGESYTQLKQRKASLNAGFNNGLGANHEAG